jgi:hypothetical protein
MYVLLYVKWECVCGYERACVCVCTYMHACDGQELRVMMHIYGSVARPNIKSRTLPDAYWHTYITRQAAHSRA